MGYDETRKGELNEISSQEKRLTDDEIRSLRERIGRLEEQKRGLSEPEPAGDVWLLDKIAANKYALIGIAIVILVIGIWLRTPLLKFTGFFEPDGFFHYSIINQAVANGFRIPRYSIYSGFAPKVSPHNQVTEPYGFYYVTLIPYFFLRFLGVSTYMVERWMAIVFGAFDMVASYFVIKHIGKSRVLGLLAMLMVALSSGNMARTTGGVYRGDGFITIFVLLMLLLLFKGLESEDRTKKYLYMIGANTVFGIGTAVWGGATFAFIVYMLGVMSLVVYGYIEGNERRLMDTVILSLTFLIAYLILRFWNISWGGQYILQPGGEALDDLSFFIYYIPMLIASVVFYFLLRRKSFKYNSTAVSRAIVISAMIAVAAILMVVLFYNQIYNLYTGRGQIIASGSLQTTIEELQHPTFAFLWISFSLEILLAPIGVAMFLLFSGGKTLSGVKASRQYECFLLLLSYLAVTAYAQAGAIRYNSLLAAPLALFSAYAIYSVGKLLYKTKVSGLWNILLYLSIMVLLVALIVFSGLMGGFILLVISPLSASLNWSSYLAWPLVIASILAACSVYLMWRTGKKIYPYMMIVVVIILLVSFIAYSQTMSESQADGINPAFINATVWIRNNTSLNATFVTLWPDGSVIEGWGQRQSLMDSVNGQNDAIIYNFSAWLFNTTMDPAYLYRVKPDYILVRNFWFSELAGVAIEGNVTNQSAYGLDALTPLSPVHNSTTNTNIFPFESGTFRALLYLTPENGSSLVQAYASYGNSSFIPLNHVILFSNSNGTFQDMAINSNALNYTLFVAYSESGGSFQIGQSAILSPKLAQSNLFKMIILCVSECPYSNDNISLSLAYANSDTKIFKVNYLNAALYNSS